MEKVIAVLVAYNPDEECLIKDIESFIGEVDKLIICNNSNFQLEKKVEFSDLVLKKTEIINFYENIGIAKAQNIGMKKAFDDGADFVLQMDQDSIFEKGSVIKLQKTFHNLRKKGINVGILGGATLDIKEQNKKNNECICDEEISCREVKAIISSGSLIPKDVYCTVGDMMEELFIDLVDTEYCWRIKKYGFKIIQNFDIKMYHQTGSGYVEYRGKKYLISAPIRNYYQMRNELYLLKLNYAPFSWKIRIIKNLYRKLWLFPRIMDEGQKRKEYTIRGIKDWKEKRMGKITEQ